MTSFEVISAVGLFAGPLSAVLVTLWSQQKTQLHSRRLDVARKLLDTHHDVSRREYSSAIRLVPVEFRKDGKVLEAWRSLMDNVSQQASPENSITHYSQFLDRKYRMIAEICRSVGIRMSEADVRSSLYEAAAYSNDRDLDRNAKRALIDIASHLKSLPTRPE